MVISIKVASMMLKNDNIIFYLKALSINIKISITRRDFYTCYNSKNILQRGKKPDVVFYSKF